MNNNSKRILIVSDKFKGSLSSQLVAESIAKGIKKANFRIEINTHTIADGGEGSLEVIKQHKKLSKKSILTLDPLGRRIWADYLYNQKSAFIELASASGVMLLDDVDKNPMISSTYGTGLMLRDAFAKGISDIYLLLGGSATIDAGIGIAYALGIDFLDRDGNILKPIGENLIKIRSIKKNHHYDYNKTSITLLCDVDTIPTGKNGAAQLFGKQKGANTKEIEYLDKGVECLLGVLSQQFNIHLQNLKGGGAAGAVPVSLVSIMNAKIKKGFEFMAEISHLEAQIKKADFVISGEGKLDQQSFHGKVVQGVAALCQKHKKPLSLLVGINKADKETVQSYNIRSINSVIQYAQNFDDAMENPKMYLEKMAFDLVKDMGLM